jgi:hypothetical protein
MSRKDFQHSNAGWIANRSKLWFERDLYEQIGTPGRVTIRSIPGGDGGFALAPTKSGGYAVVHTGESPYIKIGEVRAQRVCLVAGGYQARVMYGQIYASPSTESNNPYVKLTPAQRQELLEAIDRNRLEDGSLPFRMTKQLAEEFGITSQAVSRARDNSWLESYKQTRRYETLKRKRQEHARMLREMHAKLRDQVREWLESFPAPKSRRQTDHWRLLANVLREQAEDLERRADERDATLSAQAEDEDTEL